MPVPVALPADRVTVKVPAATVGVPEMRPVEVLMERPVGSPVALKEAGIRGEEAIHWIEGLHEVRLGRQVAVQRWMKAMPKAGQGGVWNLPEDEVEVLVASLS